jgi:hypothetical protein
MSARNLRSQTQVPVKDNCPDRPAGWGDVDFEPQRMVRWLGPAELLGAGVRAALAAVFGEYADKREIQAALSEPEPHDYSNEEEIWIDFVADLGDGFDSTYTIAWLLAQEQLDLLYPELSEPAPRGRLLIMGGDEVYPTANWENYQNRMSRPYKAALPCTPEGKEPHLFAIPGNHDWYDGLTSFLRIFCQDKWIGGWRTKQSRSYFAISLPHRWWIWGIDIQFDSYIDEPQLLYFKDLFEEKKARSGDNIILLTGKPSWVHHKLKGDESYKRRLRAPKNLAYFEDEVVKSNGARVAVTLSGDLHHYSRYEGAGMNHKITAGGGGAYLYPTHHLPNEIDWPPGDEKAASFRRVSMFPREDESKGLRKHVLWLLPGKNWTLSLLAGVVHVFIAWMIQFSVRVPGQSFERAVRSLNSVGSVVAGLLSSPIGLLVLLSIFIGLLFFADGRGAKRVLAGSLHGLAQVVVVIPLVLGSAQISRQLIAGQIRDRVDLLSFLFDATFLMTVGIGGGLIATLFLSLYLLISHVCADLHPNETFAAQRIEGYKNFIRMRIRPDGVLEMFPVGVRHICKQWRFEKERPLGDPWIHPSKTLELVRIEKESVQVRPH